MISHCDEDLRRALLALVAEDTRLRAELAADGSLYEGYHPKMQAVHQRNAARLTAVLDERGWPGASSVGRDGAEAAWLIAKHAIGEPAFQRRCLRILQEAAASGDVPAWQPAMLEDRVRMFEGRPQLYVTQLERDEDGTPRPYVIEDPEQVEERRCAVGLEPLSERLAREKPEPLPRDRERFEGEYQSWLLRVGWRS